MKKLFSLTVIMLFAAMMPLGLMAQKHDAPMADDVSTLHCADAPVVNGLLYRKGTYSGTLTNGVYSFHAAETVAFQKESPESFTADGFTSFYAKGKYYVINSTGDCIMDVYDATTWEKTGSFNLGQFIPMRGCCYNPATGRAYLAAWAKDYSCKQILTINISNGQTSELENYGNHFFNMLVTGKDNNLYAVDAMDSKLYCIDPVAGDIEEVGKISIPEFGNAMTSGVVDMKTGKCYTIMPTHYGDRNHLYELDLKTASVTLLTDMPEHAQFTGLFFPDVDKKAPDAACNITLNGSTLAFDVPTTTFDNSALTGDVTAKVTIDGTLSTFTVAPGSHFSENFTLASGLHQFEIVLSNAAGDSRLKRFSAFSGVDVPGAPKDVKFEYEDITNTATITWKAPEVTHSGLPLTASEITYNVIRQPEGVTVATGLSAMTYSEQLPSGIRAYYYDIVAVGDGNVGDAGASNKITRGDHYEVPFLESFDDSYPFSLYTGEGWGLHSWGNSLACSGLSYGWFITPAIKGLDNDHAYRISFSTGGGTFEVPRDMKVYVVDGTEFDEATAELIGKFDFTDDQAHTYNIVYEPKTSGEIRLCFRLGGFCASINNSFDDLRVDIDASKDAPGAVTDIVLTPGEKGALNNTLKFKAPTKNYRGDKTLTSLDEIVIYRNSETADPVKVFTEVEPGKEYTFYDEEPGKGLVTYYIRANDAVGMGQQAVATDFVGPDIPAEITNLSAVLSGDNEATLTWEPVSSVGLHGGYVDVANVKYVIERSDANGSYFGQVTSDATGNTFVDNTFVPQGHQEDVRYRVRARSEAGTGHPSADIPFLLGYPYHLPFHESFKNGKTECGPWRNLIVEGDTSWGVVQDGGLKAFDNDNGKAIFSTDKEEPQQTIYRSPRISLNDVVDPALSFYVYHGYADAPEDAYINVSVSLNDGEPVSIGKINICNGENGWMRHVFELKDYVEGTHNAVFFLEGYINGNNSDIVIDNINIDTQVDYDLEILGWSMPDRMDVDVPTPMTVRVLNAGALESDDYQVRLYRNGKAIQTIENTPLKSNEIKDFTFEYTPVITEARDSVEFYMRAVMMSDSKGSNNKTDVQKAYIAAKGLPFVKDLKGQYKNGQIALSWTQPLAEMRDEVTDGFDDYDAFIIDNIGDYRVYDGDKAISIYFSGVAIDHRFDPQAWQVWNWEEAEFTHIDVCQPHSGNQMLAAWSATDGRSCSLPNDNWLFSEEITGGTDVRFWAKESQTTMGPESFEIYYATGNVDFTNLEAATKQFHLLNSKVIDHTDWREYAFTLPDNATYFAIRHNTVTDGMVLFIDDLTFTPRFGGCTDLDLVKYNIYRDGELVGNTTKEAYVENVEDGNTYSYQVSTVWDLGESILSKVCEVATIDGITTVTTVDGLSIERGKIVLSLADAKNVAVYTVDGKLVYSNKAAKDAAINVAAGVYNVKIGNKNHKIIVR